MANNFLNYTNSNYINKIDETAEIPATIIYAAEYNLLKNLTYGVLISSSISKGQIKAIDSLKAFSVPGVITIVSHLNRPDLPVNNYAAVSRDQSMNEHDFHIFYDNRIHFYRQPVALVIANTLESAISAARLVRVVYSKEPHYTRILRYKTKLPVKRIKTNSQITTKPFQISPVIIQAEYNTSVHAKMPVKMQAVIGVSSGSYKIGDFNDSEVISKVQKDIKKTFKIKDENVPVHTTSMSVGHEPDSRLWAQEVAAILGVKKTGKPVVVVSGKDQLGNMAGYRPASVQKFTVCASIDGIINGIAHEAVAHKVFNKEISGAISDAAKSLYAGNVIKTVFRRSASNGDIEARVKEMGGSCGSFAFESLLDELSCFLRIDPIALRIKNFNDKEPENSTAKSKNVLIEYYELGMQSFGWHLRNTTPCAVQKGDWRLGMGMSGGLCKPRVASYISCAGLHVDGSLLIQSSISDLGKGTENYLIKIAAEAFEIDFTKVKIEWGSSALPATTGEIRSYSIEGVVSTIYELANKLHQKTKELAVNTKFFNEQKADDLRIKNWVIIGSLSPTGVPVTEVLKENNLQVLEVVIDSKNLIDQGLFSAKSFCAHFVEVMAHSATARIKVTRIVTVVDAGKISDLQKAARAVYHAINRGLAISLFKENAADNWSARIADNSLVKYSAGINIEVPSIEVIFVNRPGEVFGVNEMNAGTEALEDITFNGFSSAVANAVYNATGKRIRSLPIPAGKYL